MMKFINKVILTCFTSIINNLQWVNVVLRYIRNYFDRPQDYTRDVIVRSISVINVYLLH